MSQAKRITSETPKIEKTYMFKEEQAGPWAAVV